MRRCYCCDCTVQEAGKLYDFDNTLFCFDCLIDYVKDNSVTYTMEDEDMEEIEREAEEQAYYEEMERRYEAQRDWEIFQR